MTDPLLLLDFMKLDRALTPQERRRIFRRGTRVEKGTRPGARASSVPGPNGETCGTCKNLVRHQMSKHYWKCGLTNWTRGVATDIRRADPACSRWEKRDV